MPDDLAELVARRERVKQHTTDEKTTDVIANLTTFSSTLGDTQPKTDPVDEVQCAGGQQAPVLADQRFPLWPTTMRGNQLEMLDEGASHLLLEIPL